jgi:hypothetical protein
MSDIDEFNRRKKQFNLLRKKRMNDEFKKQVIVANLQNKTWLQNMIFNRHFYIQYIIDEDLFEFVVETLLTAVHKNKINEDDYRKFIRKIYQNNIEDEHKDRFLFEIVKGLFNITYGFPTAKRISQATGISIEKVQEILQRSTTFLEFKKPTQTKSFRMIQANFVDEIWEADLIDFNRAKINDETIEQDEQDDEQAVFIKQYNLINNIEQKYILIVIDVFSRFVWFRPLSDKSGVSVFYALEDIIRKNKIKPRKLQVDNGKEFHNQTVQNLMNRLGITMYSSKIRTDIDTQLQYNSAKAFIAERVIRTIKEIMWKYFKQNQTYKWIDIIEHIVNGYNHRIHSYLKMSPNDARLNRNYNQIYYQHRKRYKNNLKYPTKFNIGDKVKIKIIKKTFEKGFTQTFSNEVYEIIDVKYDGWYYYVLNNDIKSFWYESELLKVI